jgi:hypothetical protein
MNVSPLVRQDGNAACLTHVLRSAWVFALAPCQGSTPPSHVDLAVTSRSALGGTSSLCYGMLREHLRQAESTPQIVHSDHHKTSAL